MLSYEKYSVLRDKKGMKDAHIAKLAGITNSTFSDWKNGRSEPKQSKLEKISNVLGVPTSYFYSDSDNGSDNMQFPKEIIDIAVTIAYDKNLKQLFDIISNKSEFYVNATISFIETMEKNLTLLENSKKIIEPFQNLQTFEAAHVNDNTPADLDEKTHDTELLEAEDGSSDLQ